MLGGKPQNCSHQIGKAYHSRTRYKQAHQCSQQKQLQNTRLFSAQKAHTEREIFLYHRPNLHLVFRLFIIQPDKTFKKRRHKEAKHCRIKYRLYPKYRVKYTSQEGSNQRGNCRHLIDNRIALYNMIPGQHLRDACLHRRRFKSSQYRENYQQNPDYKNIVAERHDNAGNQYG